MSHGQRIGLAHGGEADENDDARKAVDFEAYHMRITDGSGDVVPEGNDVATVMSRGLYESALRASAHSSVLSQVKWPVIQPAFRVGIGATPYKSLADNELMISNVRINDGGNIVVALHNVPAAERPFPFFPSLLSPDSLSPVLVEPLRLLGQGNAFAMPPDEHRDFPDDVLSSDETYTVTAWAVNDAGAVISPVATLKLHPVDTASDITTIKNYENPRATTVSDVVLTEFTVLK